MPNSYPITAETVRVTSGDCVKVSSFTEKVIIIGKNKGISAKNITVIYRSEKCPEVLAVNVENYQVVRQAKWVEKIFFVRIKEDVNVIISN